MPDCHLTDNITSDYELNAVDILRIRYWQHLLNESLKNNAFEIPIHLAFGHEASAVALHKIMQSSDKLCLTHRNIAYNLARSKSLNLILKHFRLTDSSDGLGQMGSMNLATKGTGIAYTSSILGNNLGVASGIAMHRSLASLPGVVFVITGDGAIEEGIFWETLVFSKSHSLPLVIVVENNDYSLGSNILERRSDISLQNVCTGIGIKYISAVGPDYESCRNAYDLGRRFASSGNPVCIEINLTTLCRHAGPTPGWPTDPMTIDLEAGLLIIDGPQDPVHHIRNTVGLERFQILESFARTGVEIN